MHLLRYNKAHINNALLDIIATESNWQRFFNENNIAPFELFYEDLDSDLQLTMMRLLKHWEFQEVGQINIPEPETVVISDEITEEWLSRYLSESLLADNYLYSELLNGNFLPLLAQINTPFENVAMYYWSQRLPYPLWKLAFFVFIQERSSAILYNSQIHL